MKIQKISSKTSENLQDNVEASLSKYGFVLNGTGSVKSWKRGSTTVSFEKKEDCVEVTLESPKSDDTDVDALLALIGLPKLKEEEVDSVPKYTVKVKEKEVEMEQQEPAGVVENVISDTEKDLKDSESTTPKKTKKM